MYLSMFLFVLYLYLLLHIFVTTQGCPPHSYWICAISVLKHVVVSPQNSFLSSFPSLTRLTNGCGAVQWPPREEHLFDARISLTKKATHETRGTLCYYDSYMVFPSFTLVCVTKEDCMQMRFQSAHKWH